MEKIIYTIDASGRTLGRVASEAASALVGKKTPQFTKNIVLPVSVTITNVKKLSLPERRLAGKSYVRYTGYPGGLKTTSLPEFITKKGLADVRLIQMRTRRRMTRLEILILRLQKIPSSH